jgi:Na+/H+-translocating membrane pyrophosphatase
MARYIALPQDDANDQPLPASLGLKIAKWVYIFDIVRTLGLAGLVGLNIDATVISRARFSTAGDESLLSTLLVAMVEKSHKGLSKMQLVELGVTIFYVSSHHPLASHRLDG